MLNERASGRPVRLTVLSDMAGRTAAEQAEQAAAWRLSTIDVKSVAGKNIVDVSDAEADAIAAAYGSRGIAVDAFSTHLFNLPVENGPAAFEDQLGVLSGVLMLARRLRPRAIRLLAASTKARASVANSAAYLRSTHPWLIPLYGQAVDMIHAAGCQAVIENETGPSIFANPAEIVDFFHTLGRREKVALTWDVQNLWQQGIFPTLSVYRTLKPYIGYLHLKGGLAGPDGRTLKWRCGLEAASWPVVEITRAVLADGVSPVICLNPSHGEAHPQHPAAGVFERDLAYLRGQFPGQIV